MLKVCITGGPGGGKTDIMSKLYDELTSRGYTVLICNEAATELYNSGIHCNQNIKLEDFQELVLDTQLYNEAVLDKFLELYPEKKDKSVILCDRGFIDQLAYIDKDKFVKMLKKRNLTFADALSRYDAVLHLVTAANGAEKYYVWNNPNSSDVGNNAARRESPKEAREKDKITLQAWIGHPHLRVFDNSTDYQTKIKKATKEVFNLLGEPSPKEIERKFLIKRPTKEELNKLGFISKNYIIQNYLLSDNENIEKRIRLRGTNEDGFIFFYTEKITGKDPKERIEYERVISNEEYLAHSLSIDPNLHSIKKTRYCFVYNNQYFELDEYPFSKDYAILEIELDNLEDELMLPPTIEVIKEVTDDNNYKNHSLAMNLSFDNVPKKVLKK